MPTCRPATRSMRDCARFHFGFTVPFVPHMGAAGVVAAVSASKGDLGLVPAFDSGRRRRLVERARIRRRAQDHRAAALSSSAPDHPAALPVFVISRAARRRHGDAKSRSGACGSRAGAPAPRRRVAPLADVIAVPDRAFDGAALLVSVPQGRTLEAISAALVKAGATVRSAALVGSHATRYTVRPADDRPRSAALTRLESHGMTVLQPPATAPRRARHRRLCAGQEQRAGRRQGVQAVLERDAARAEPEGDRGLSRGRRAPRGLSGRLGAEPCARRSARAFGLDPDRIVCGAGSDDLLNLLARAYLSRRRRGDLHQARLSGLSDRDAGRRREAGRRAGDELHRRCRRDPRRR